MENLLQPILAFLLRVAPIAFITCAVVFFGHWITIRAYKIFKGDNNNNNDK